MVFLKFKADGYRIWRAVEGFIFPRLEHIWTVNDSIAELYFKDYGIRPKVFRNISHQPDIQAKSRLELGLPKRSK